MLTLKLLPLIPFGAVLNLNRRINCEGMVGVGGNYYSVPGANWCICSDSATTRPVRQ